MEIDKAVEELSNEIRQFNDETVAPIKERLASLEERDTSINDQKVIDLEKRLCEAEARSTETLNELKEQVRISEAEKGLLPSAGERSSDPFKGFIFKDVDKVRRELLSGSTRAIDLTDIASAGKLTDETASAFLDFVVGDNPTLSVIEKRVMNSPTARLDRIGVGTRKLVAASENTEPDATDGVTFGARSLAVTEAIWAEDISLSFLEDNIAGGNAEQQIANVVAKAIGEELNDLAWNGDGTTTGFLAINTGFEALMDADSDSDVTDVDMTSNSTLPTAIKALYKGSPAKYRTISDQTIFCSPGFAVEYLHDLTARETVAGDAGRLNGINDLRYFGVPLVVDRFLDSDKIYMTPASNLVFGVHRDVTQELDWNPRKRQVELTVSLRFDFNYKFGGAITRGHTLAAGLE